MRKLTALAAAIALVFALSAGPAKAQTIATPPVVIDRTAVTLTYMPTGGTTTWNAALSYQYSPTWDVLVSFISPPTGLPSAFRVGGRYHLRRLSPQTDVFANIGYFSPSTGTTHIELGGGLVQTVAPGLRMYAVSTYNTATTVASNPYISTNLGFQYEINRQWAVVAGYEEQTGFGYIGVNFDFSNR
ncbi:MAG: hypothetical protein E6G99_08380 [Bacillati bacterium ANGP1]|uniref:Porin family protein n=1 Tax=Candidatus Segetimicrobium genomatis TaxID=2569760 RepID=A0A537LG35_9BACT|nr:MAG: hypothetical protein E6G99_08380 [Terrabacteria group bacterium ANGP1]